MNYPLVESEITNFESLVSNKFTNGQHLEKTNGKKIEADLVINCNEPEPSKDFCKEALGKMQRHNLGYN